MAGDGTNSYVCAFRGRRDSYQVPLALAEACLLDQFITDAYGTAWVRKIVRWAPAEANRLAAFRREPGIPEERVKCLWGTTLLEHSRHKLGYASSGTYHKLDRQFSLAAARRAAKQRANLLLYSPYAREAFTAAYPHTPHRVLFQYHPHAEFESRLLAEDKRRFPDVGESFSGASGRNGREALPPRDHDVWRHADLILCASAFTRRSLEEVGCDPKKCRIVPYGIEMPRQPVVANLPPESFQVVFVGSGGQRKGLHHLLLAWKGAKLPKSSRLTLVCRAIDRGIEKMLPEIPRVTLSGGMTQTELDRLYAGATLFAMPSLVEGFGQVYLEAMAHGCPVLGTRNTGLPELGGEADGVFTVEPGDIDALVDKLERLSEALSGDEGIRRRTAAHAARFSWPAFRNGVRDALTSSASQTRAT